MCLVFFVFFIMVLEFFIREGVFVFLLCVFFFVFFCVWFLGLVGFVVYFCGGFGGRFFVVFVVLVGRFVW